VRTLVIIAAGIVLSAAPAAAGVAAPSARRSTTTVEQREPAPEPRGFTVDVALGVGMVATGEGGAIGGRAVNVGVGSAITPRTAVTLRLHRARVTIPAVEGDGADVAQTYFGLTVQHRLSPRFFIGGGAGHVRLRSGFGADEGLGLQAGAGYDVLVLPIGAFQIGLHGMTGLYGNTDWPLVYSATATVGFEVY
jgi:hypothetical protein